MFVLVCSCGSKEFTYDSEEGFVCKKCGDNYQDQEAGHHLLEMEE